MSQPSTREPKQLVLSRTPSASSKAPSDTDSDTSLLMSRNTSPISLKETSLVEEEDLQDEEENAQPPRKRQRMSESPEPIMDSTEAEHPLPLEFSLPQSPEEAREASSRSSSPELILLPSQPPPAPKPVFRQEMLDTSVASWSKILNGPSAPKEPSSSTSQTSGLSQRFSRTPTSQQAVPLDFEEDLDDFQNSEYLENDPIETVLSPQQPAKGPPPLPPPSSKNVPYQNHADSRVAILDSIQSSSKHTEPPVNAESTPDSTPEIEVSGPGGSLHSTTASLDLNRLRKAYEARGEYLSRVKGKVKAAAIQHVDTMEGANIDAAEAQAEATLSRTVKQPDFARMRICGQFNLGFIVARRVETRDQHLEDDLFIIGSHIFPYTMW